MIDIVFQLLGVDPSNPDVVVAVVRGVSSSIGVIFTAFITLFIWICARITEAYVMKRTRCIRQQDVLVALHAEIMAGGMASRLQSSEQEKNYAVQNVSPFQVADRTDFVFQTVKKDISILPERAVHDIVLYYRLAEQSNLMTEALTSEDFKSQDSIDRRKFIRQLLDLADDQAKAARSALNKIESSLPSQTSTPLQRKREDTLPEQQVGSIRQSGGSDQP